MLHVLLFHILPTGHFSVTQEQKVSMHVQQRYSFHSYKSFNLRITVAHIPHMNVC